MQVFRRSEQELKEVSHNPELKKRVIFGEGVCGSIPQLATIDMAPGEQTTEHTHVDMDEIFYVVSGQLELEVEGECVSCSTGDTVLIKAGEKHVLGNGSATSDLTLLYFGVLQPS